MGADLFLADRQTDRQTDVTQLIVTFRNFANAPKMVEFHYLRLSGEGEKIESETKHDRRKKCYFISNETAEMV